MRPPEATTGLKNEKHRWALDNSHLFSLEDRGNGGRVKKNPKSETAGADGDLTAAR